MNRTATYLTFTFAFLASIGLSQAAPKTTPAKTVPTAYVQVLASVGPLQYLSGAVVTVKNAKGQVLGRRKTNIRGSTLFYLPESKISHLPLKFITSGGQLITQTGDQLRGPRFLGHLQGETIDVSLSKHSITYLDLLSTTAFVMRTGVNSYSYSTQMVRDAFNIAKGYPKYGVRFKNNYIDWALLKSAMKRNGGHDNYVRKLASQIKSGKKITELTPSTHTADNKQSTSPRISDSVSAQSTSSSTYPVCNAALPSNTAGSSSTELIEDFGSIAISSLLKVAGAPSAAASGIAGMLLTGGASGSAADNTALQDVDEQLVCISQQLSYLSSVINTVSLEVITTEGTTCQSAAQTDYENYSTLVSNAQPSSSGSNPPVLTSAPANEQLTSNNNNLMLYVTPTESPNWLTNYACGDTINNMLFVATTGTNSAWQQLNINYQNDYAWYTQLQSQQLQQYLSYWGTLAYYEWVVNNEYYNYNDDTTDAMALAGNVPGSSSVCLANTTGANYCYYQNNIANAFPSDLFSDEIGLYQNGYGINAFPAGLAMTDNGSGSALGQLGLTAGWIYSNSSNFPQYWSADAAATGSPPPVNPSGSPSDVAYSNNAYGGATNAAYAYFNAQGINSSGQSSAVEQFSNPQALRTFQPVSSDVSALQKPQQSGGLTAISFFLSAINATPGTGQPAFPIASDWGALSASNDSVGFYTADNVTKITVGSTGQDTCDSGLDEETETNFTAYNTIGQYTYSHTGCSKQGPGSTPVFGALLGRTWWSGVTKTTTYTPPTPIVEAGQPTNLSATTTNPGEITLTFSAPTSTGGSTITSYTANCSNAPITNSNVGNGVCEYSPGGTSITGTASNSPITLSGFTTSNQPYTCIVVAETLAPGTCSYVTATPLAAVPPAAPTNISITSISTSTQANVSIAFSPPSNTGGSAISGYLATCTSTGNPSTTGSATASPVVVANLIVGATYICSVQAKNVIGTGAASATTSTSGGVAPSAPTLISPAYVYQYNYEGVSNAYFALTYSLPSNPGSSGSVDNYLATCTNTSGVSYTGYQGDGNPNNNGTNPPTSSFAIVIPGTIDLTLPYSCSVQAINTFGLGTPSNVLTATIYD